MRSGPLRFFLPLQPEGGDLPETTLFGRTTGIDVRRALGAHRARLTGLASRARPALTRLAHSRVAAPSSHGWEPRELRLTILESALDPIITFDETGRIIDFNPAAEKTFGYSREEVIDHPAADLLVPPSLRKQHLETLERLRETAGASLAGRTFETMGMRSDGSEIPVELSIGRVMVSERLLFTACVRDVTKRRQAEASRAQLASLVRASADAIIGHTLDGVITSWNGGAERLFGYTGRNAVGRHIKMLLAPEQGRVAALEVVRNQPHSSQSQEHVTGVASNGKRLHLALTTSPVKDESDRITHAVTIARDVGERVEAEARRAELEQQLHQSQKMEAIGRLASGVAHDFNNLLSVIINYANFLADELEQESAARDDVERIRQAGLSAVGLVRQLLLFSRKEAVEPEIVDVNQLVLGMEKLLRRAIGEDIRLETRLATDLWLTKVDPGQLEQVLMNLSVNARDALAHGGTLSIDTSNVTTDEYFARKHGASAGDYVRIAVSDNGPGMSAEVRAHIFEPFYTTKSESEGTGLGLATVYAIVQGVHGCINVTSELGVGTTFDIYLPATQERQEARATTPRLDVPRARGETILVVEDEPGVRELAQRILHANGYNVLVARSGREALELGADLQGPLHVLLTDVIMPHMSGQELASWLRQIKKGFATVFMSGYTDQAVGSRALHEDGVSFLQKPFTAERLLQEVHDVLHESRLTGRKQRLDRTSSASFADHRRRMA